MLDVIRVVTTPDAIGSIASDGVVLQIAPDEALVLDATEVVVDDEHAITVVDDGHVGVQLPREELEAWCRREAEWELPSLVSYFTQGMVAGLAVKIWVNGDTALVLCRTSLRRDLEERM
ncbi:MAG TPA: hypothetical protein VMS74_06960 [Acidimicrobiia bacterium]|nr:hypothetical protein [Acidimicrobiia bacterium]